MFLINKIHFEKNTIDEIFVILFSLSMEQRPLTTAFHDSVPPRLPLLVLVVASCCLISFPTEDWMFFHTFSSLFSSPLPSSLDNKLNFDDHIFNIVTNAYQRANLIFCGFTFRYHRLLVCAYTTFVRPLLEYCTSAWSPYLMKDINKIENVQWYFTRRLFPLYSYNERLFLLELETLECRRLKFDLKLYYQTIHEQINIDKSTLFEIVPNFRIIKIQGAITTDCKNSYSRPTL